MNTVLVQNKLFAGSVLPASYLWKNLKIEKSDSAGWFHDLYKGSVLDSFWRVLTSRVN